MCNIHTAAWAKKKKENVIMHNATQRSRCRNFASSTAQIKEAFTIFGANALQDRQETLWKDLLGIGIRTLHQSVLNTEFSEREQSKRVLATLAASQESP